MPVALISDIHASLPVLEAEPGVRRWPGDRIG
jgi:hypothetical protein